MGMFDPERVLAALATIENGEGVIYPRCIQCRLIRDDGVEDPTLCDACERMRVIA